MMQNSSSTSAQITAWDSEAVSEFAKSKADILVLERRTLDNLGPVVNAGRVHEYFTTANCESVDSKVRAGMSELQLESPELAEDLQSLVVSFLDQFEVQEVRFRIELTQTQACPKFHCDNVHVRLVMTYLGPTTEYQYAGENSTHHATVGGLVFLKGHRHATCGDTVHHRSPEVPDGERRLCVAIDY